MGPGAAGKVVVATGAVSVLFLDYSVSWGSPLSDSLPAHRSLGCLRETMGRFCPTMGSLAHKTHLTRCCFSFLPKS